MAPFVEQGSRDRSTSTGASGLPEHEHKRPRLDTDAEMDASANSTSEANQTRRSPKLNTNEETHRSPSLPAPASTKQTQVALSPTSKVTINTRPLSAQSVHQDIVNTMSEAEKSLSLDAMSKETSPTVINADDIRSSTTEPGGEKEPISIPSSPSEVVIEIGPPEDIDYASTSNDWDAPSNGSASRSLEALWDTFPMNVGTFTQDIVHALKDVQEVIAKSTDERFVRILRSLALWLNTLVGHLNHPDLELSKNDVELLQWLPNLLSDLMKRRPAITTDTSGTDITDFVISFASATMAIMRLDCRRLGSKEKLQALSEEYWCLSIDYIQQLAIFIFPDTPTNFHKHMRTFFQMQPQELGAHVSTALFQSISIQPLECLARLFDAFVEALPSTSAARVAILTMVTSFRSMLSAIFHYKIQLSVQQREVLRTRITQFVGKTNDVVQHAISKQQPWLSIETSTNCLEAASRLMSLSAINSPELANSTFRAAHIDTENLSVRQMQELSYDAYRLLILRLFVQHGRMELRVSGIEAMANTFVTFWKRIQEAAPDMQTILLKFVVDFLRNNDLVRYLLGVDCHPQVVQRSANVIGFLGVANQWQTLDSDMAWNAILENPDHRSTSAIVDMLKLNLQHLQLEALVHMLDGVYRLQFERIDQQMLSFILDLLNSTIQKAGTTTSRYQDLNAVLIRLCLHLLQTSHTSARCATEIAEHMREYIYSMLTRERVSIGAYNIMDLTSPDTESLMNLVLDSISRHTEHATGSILIATAVIDSLDGSNAFNTIASIDFAGKLLDDIIFLSQHRIIARQTTPGTVEVEYEIRLKSLEHLIVKLPESLDGDFCEKLGANLLSSSIDLLRSRTWAALANAYKQTNSSNTVLDYAASYFMEQQSTTLLDKPVLDFCKASVAFELRQSSTSAASKQESVSIHAMEKIWKMMLETADPSVENEASQYIIRTYLDSKTLASHDSVTIQNTHTMLINRCIEIVVTAAQQLRDSRGNSNLTPIGGGKFAPVSWDTEEVHLHRALNLLRKFLASWRSKPQFKPTAAESFGPVLDTFPVRGDVVELKLNVANHPGMRSGTLSWTVGEENTGHELWRFLMDITGWAQVMVIKSGARLQLQDVPTSVVVMQLEQAPLYLSKPLGTAELGPGRAIRATSPIDSTIMHHFDDLFALLDCQDSIAKDIYEFLAMFPAQRSIVNEIKSQAVPSTSLLPIDKPFKLLYYANIMRSNIEEESFSLSPDTNFLRYAIRIAVSTLACSMTLPNANQITLKMITALLELLQLALRAKVSMEVSESYFEEPEKFVSDLMGTWISVQDKIISSDENVTLQDLDSAFLDVIIEACLHEKRLWHYINDDHRLSEVLAFALLTNGSEVSRRSSLEVIARLSGVSTTSKQALKLDDPRAPRGRFTEERIEFCMQQLWLHLSTLIAKACTHSLTCQQSLEACAVVLECVSTKLDDRNLKSIFLELEGLLLGHRCIKVEQCNPKDTIVSMLARMMISCTKAFGSDEDGDMHAESLVRSIWQNLLLPPLSDASTASLERQLIPVLDIGARTALYELVLALSHNTQRLSVIVAELKESTIDQDHFRHWTSNERKALRSEQGFAGLHNLSNTCYLNSLFTQLFMNIKFRELIIGISIVDPLKQQLIRELGALFANMQSSLEKYVDPTAAIASITQYSGEEIDVTVQMDVDEFFNLLFDRLEAQILDSGSRQAFKSLYGGQLVQQIKSKECEHVSERLEPFSAVQIEIKGKMGLEEGLAAYVEGEVLQGENKYSCTSCGRHVDAVKRACLKELPDNLIFNLKRFDYDIFTGVRTKINDEFQFPNEINMTPYTLDALSEPVKDMPADVFELVGVIVHSGTAETGHYYSFTRRRPSLLGTKQSWVQFNDQDVTHFEPSQLKDQAFGGYDTTFSNFPKFYNGYMLFYERRSNLQASEKDRRSRNPNDIFAVPLPEDLDNRIALENEICLRRYVTQDPSHSSFIRQVTERLFDSSIPCDQVHDLEDMLIGVALDYIQQVSSRWKETPDVEDTIQRLVENCKSCARCAITVVDWFVEGETITSNVLRAFYPQARRNFATLFLSCWTTLSPLCHADRKDLKVAIDPQRVAQTLAACVKRIVADWGELQKFPRGWPDLFTLLTKIARLGEQDATMLLECELLSLTAEIVWVHADPKSKGTPTEVRRKYLTYLTAREKNRTFNHGVALDLFAELLQHVALTSSTSKNPPGIAASQDEETLLGTRGLGPLGWLQRLVGTGSNPAAALKVVRELCYYTQDLLDRTAATLVEGLNSRQYLIGCRFIQPSLVFIHYCSDKTLSSIMVQKALEAVAESDGYYCSDHLEFVQAISESDGTMSLSKDILQNLLRDNIGHWAPVLLIAPSDLPRDVRSLAFQLVQGLLLKELQSKVFEDIHTDVKTMKTLRLLALNCSEYVAKNFLATQDEDQVDRTSLSSGQSQFIIRTMEECVKYLSTGTTDLEDETLVSEVQANIESLQELEQSIEILELEEYREPSSEPMSDMESFETP